MCQTKGTCYVESNNNILAKLREEISYFLYSNTDSSQANISKFVTQICTKNLFEVDDLLDYFKREIEKGKKLATNQKESQAVRKIQTMYCSDYEKVLNAMNQTKVGV